MATGSVTTERVAVRHLSPGDEMVGGLIITRVWSGSKTSRGCKTVEYTQNGKKHVTEWSASTRVHVVVKD